MIWINRNRSQQCVIIGTSSQNCSGYINSRMPQGTRMEHTSSHTHKLRALSKPQPSSSPEPPVWPLHFACQPGSLSLPIPLYRSRLPCLDAIHRHLFCDGCADAAMPNNQSLPILLATSLDLCDLWAFEICWLPIISNIITSMENISHLSSQYPHLLAGHIHLSWQGCSPQNHQACHANEAQWISISEV